MAYEPTVWKAGDVITAEKMNKLENGCKNEQVGPQGPKGDKGDTGVQGPAGKGVASISFTTDGGGAITGGTVTFDDESTAPITITPSA